MKAAVFVDVQKDFIDGALRNEKAIEVAPKIVEFAKECVKNGYKIYATRDTHKKTKYEFYEIANGINDITLNKTRTEYPISGYLATLEGQKLPVEHCIEGTDGWMIDERLWNVIEGKTTVVNKNTFGSFDLADIMQEDLNAWDDKNYFDEIIICGFCTSICVMANVILIYAKFPNIKITVMKDLCADIDEDSHNSALKVLKMQNVEIV